MQYATAICVWFSYHQSSTVLVFCLVVVASLLLLPVGTYTDLGVGGCASEAKVYPDGSIVGRIDLNCIFAPCSQPLLVNV